MQTSPLSSSFVPAETSFCPGPYVLSGRIAPCLLDTIASAVLLAFIVVAGSVWYFGILRDARAASTGERQRLLQQDGQAAEERSHESQATRSLSSIIARIISPLVLLTYLIDLGLDFYQATHPEVPTTIIQDLSARTVADVLASFAWLIASTFVFFAATLDRNEWHEMPRDRVPMPIKQFWILAFIVETVQVYQWIAAMTHPLDEVTMLDATLDITYFIIFVMRFALLLGLIITLLVGRISRNQRASDVESVQTAPATNTPASTSSWQETWKKVGRLMPFLWPKPLHLQFLVIFCFVLLALGRVVNVLVPLQYKRVVDDLTPNGETDPNKRRPYFCWGAILLYTAFRFLQGGVGLLSSLQYFLWIPVGQYTTREVSVRMLEHLHSLSLQFHINRKTGEVLRVMDRGTSSIGSLLSYLAFNILPVFVDIALAVIVFLITFDWAIAMIVFVTMVLYIACTIWITEWRTKFRREMNELDSASRAKAVDSLLNFETVKYYNNEAWEVNAYDVAIRSFQAADWKSSASLNVLNTAQNLVITLGLLAGLLVCGKRVADGQLTIGDFVAFLTYLLQLYQPLNWFGTYYRVIQQNFIDMEKMLDLFEEGKAVKDAPNARELAVRQGGKVVFEDVAFAYDPRQPALKSVSFEAPAGKTVALVGPSGGGKSTIFRLLFRFYDIQSGSIKIDGQDIRTVKQTSLRSHIGVVPQDTVLFNDTVRYNIRYGNINATDEEVVAAAKAAQIHDRIVSFPDGYETKVGERGLRLSGGEKQRIAIARTILKNPSIILLDEATSALDNTTERLIQDSLRTLSTNRTTLVIAHRLSTIVDADLILVLKDGQIVERGTHTELLERGAEAVRRQAAKAAPGAINGALEDKGEGTYYIMWMRQLGEEKEKAAAAAAAAAAARDSAIGHGVGKRRGNGDTPAANVIPGGVMPVHGYHGAYQHGPNVGGNTGGAASPPQVKKQQ
ncbi:hypothetical protein SpCBS45565_g06690 [Spizellomyces sp. 'palustris']|nr:hypothetical protein SpCBS45565_g06690 [Spizellomyces sp. 'palustris']